MITTGICQYRAQAGKPCFFVNDRTGGRNDYQFFIFAGSMHSYKATLEGLYERLNKLDTCVPHPLHPLHPPLST